MSVLGKWRIVEMPDYESDFPDMIEPAYILFDRSGNDEMDEASGDGWAELREDGTIEGQICFQGGDDADFIARPW